jgi:tetratricopeptide (TPR) repeat protein
MNRTAEIIRGSLIMLFCLALFGWLLIRALKRSEDPPKLLFKWILTASIFAFAAWKVLPTAGNGGGDSFMGVAMAMICGLAITAIWRHSIASMVSKPFEALFTGGDIEPEPRPAYSVARTRQKQGKYLEAVTEIRKQLDHFPTDIEGLMLLAEIQAEDMKDLPGAELTIDRFCAQKHAPKNIAFALSSMADWNLKIGQDREAAKRNLERIIAMLPETEFALGAAQRIAHLGTTEMLLAPHERKKYTVVEGPKNIGLMQDHNHLKPVAQDPGLTAAEYVKHLAEHPFDSEVREKLAVVYADHYGRLDLAVDQLDQLANQPNQPGKLVVRWLNAIADLQIRHGAEIGAIEQTIQRIIDLDPESAAANIARNRMATLKLELKGKRTNEPVKMGSYEQNIGLKQSRNPR